MDNKRVYEALKTLKECCAENPSCISCPLSVGHNPSLCMIADNESEKIPKYWNLNSDVDYKAFKE